ncbi:MAG: EscU/YscU/HrcU family type III secretion system export apparatus switch protein [Pseudomonadota bacterium]
MIASDELKQAVALFYDGDSAPKVTAKGEGASAEEIIAIAQEHGVTLCENESLLALLMTLELNEEIPEHLYTAIAQIIAFACYLQEKYP